MYSGGLALRKKLGVEEPPKSQRPRVHLGHPLERTHIDRLEGLRIDTPGRIVEEKVDLSGVPKSE
jgi:hypothetical protein